MLFGSTDLRPWLAAAVLAAAAIGGLSLGPAGPPAFAADSPPPATTTPTTTTPTTTPTPAPETAPVTTTPAPDKAPVPPPKTKTKTTPATPTRPARTQKAPYVPPPVSSGTVAPRAVVPLQPVRPVVKRPAQLSAKAKAQAKVKALALAQQQAQAKELARAQAQANARARAKAQAELAAILSLPWMPREPVSAAGSSPTLSFGPASVRLRAVTLLLASLGIALLALAALGAPVLGVVAGRHPGAATALYDRRTEIALAGVSLLVGITILAALTRWMT